MSEAFKVALLRALYASVVLAGSAFFGVLAGNGGLHAAEIAAGVAFFGQLILRGAVEGWIDTQNSSKSSP